MTNKNAAFRSLLHRLTTFKVLTWGQDSSAPDLSHDREEVELDRADVVSSLRPDGKHTLVIDLDHQAWLVPSTTEGHYHLYVDVPDGIEEDKYWPLMLALSQAGVIQTGYYRASKQRGHTDVRLPWVVKVERTIEPAFEVVGAMDVDRDWAES